MTRLPIDPGRRLVLFTDLDGTLIDHHTYSADGSRAALQRLSERNVPVIFCSSKTFAEQAYLQRQLGIFQPFILENGSAVAVPKGYFAVSNPLREKGMGDYDLFVFAHADARAIRSELAHFQDIKGFSDATDAELSAATGLSGEALARARDRWFTETLITQPDAEHLTVLEKKLAQKGFALSRGGRFYTIQSARVDKGKAVRWLAEIFGKNLPSEPLFAATGDSPNDAPMLAAADVAFLVQRHDGTWADLKVQISGLIKVDAPGPVGFSQAVDILLG